MKNRVWIHYTIGMMIFVLFFSQWTVVQAAPTGTEGSNIANVKVTGLDRDEIKKLLESEISTWVQGEPILLKGEYEQVEIPRKSFAFNIEASLDKWEEQTKRRWDNFFLRKKHVELPITVRLKGETIQKLPNRVNKNKVSANLEIRAGMLNAKKLNLIYVKDKKPTLKKIASEKIQFPKEVNEETSKLAGEINTVKIEPGKEFSLMKYVEDIQKTDASLEYLLEFDDEVNFYATMLYKLILQTDLKIEEHHSQGSIPTYGETGIEARVNVENKQDLKVFNSSNQTYEIQARIDKGKLNMSLSSIPAKGSYEYALSEPTYITPRTVYRYSKTLAPGQETIIQKGQAGVRVEVYRQKLNGADKLLDEKFLDRASYPAFPTIKLVSTEDESKDESAESPIEDLEDWMDTFIIEDETEEGTENEESTNDTRIDTDSDSEGGSEVDPGSESDPEKDSDSESGSEIGSDSEKALNFSPEEVFEEFDFEGSTIPNITDEDLSEKLPSIESYVDSLVKVYCEDYETEQPDEFDSDGTKEEVPNNETDVQTDDNVTEIKKGDNPNKPKFKSETDETKQSEEDDIPSETLKAKEKACAMDTELLKKQLTNYLIMDSFIEEE